MTRESRFGLALSKVSTSSKALAVVVDSSGGSPSSALNIYTQLRLFREKHGVPVLTFANEMSLSGGYLILTAGDLR